MKVTDCLLLTGPEPDPEILRQKVEALRSQGLTRIVVRSMTEAPGGSAAAIKAVEEEGFERAFFVVELTAPSVDLETLASAHETNWGVGVQAVDVLGRPLGVFLFEYRIFDYIPRAEACELSDLLERLKEQEESVFAVSMTQ